MEELPACLKFDKQDFIIHLNTIESAAKEILSQQFLQHYTDHTIDHSKRIIKILEKLLADYPALLNEQEKFILIASVYLHDIGMQSPIYAGIKKKSYTLKDAEKVREIHHETSAKMIRENVSNIQGLSLGLERCSDYIDFIAEVSRYHRKLKITELKDSSLAGEKIKLPLLAGLLKLADELDADYRRVWMKTLQLRNIPTESKFRWWFHHYVQSILIDKGLIQLFFRFPSKYKGNKLIDVFCKKVHRSISDQYLEVYDLLYNYGIKLHPKIEIKEIKYQSSGLELIPDDLKDYIEKYVIKTKNNAKTLSVKTGITWYTDGVPYSDDIKVAKSLNKIISLIDSEKYKIATREIEKCLILIMSPNDRMIFLINAGNCYYTLGDLNKAESYYNEALKFTERKDLQAIYKDDILETKSSALGNTGLIYYTKGELDKALRYHKEALKIHKEIGYKQGQASQLGNIGLIYSAKGELDQALRYHKEALKIHKEIGYKQGQASQLGNIGLIYSAKGELDKALRYHKEAIKIDKEISYRQGQAVDLGNIGLIYSAKGVLDQALRYYKEALKIHKEIGFKQGQASALGNIGLIYSAKGELDQALRYHKEALKIDKEIGYKQGQASQLGNIGLIYSDKGELDKALRYHREALKIDKEIGYKQGQASQLGNIGLIYNDKVELDQALRYHKEALKIDKEIGYKQGQASDLGNIGLIYRDKGELDQALRYHREALKIHKEISFKQGQANQLGNIGLIYSAKGELDQALKYLKNALDIFKESFPESITKTLSNIAITLFNKKEYKEGFIYLGKAFLSSLSLTQFNNIVYLMQKSIRDLIENSDWHNLEKINAIYKLGIITEENWVNFFKSIYKYAAFKKISNKKAKSEFEDTVSKLNPQLKKLLDDTLRVKL